MVRGGGSIPLPGAKTRRRRAVSDMSLTDPCGYCGIPRYDCECNNWNNYKKLPKLSWQEREYIKQLGFKNWEKIRTEHPIGELRINGGRFFGLAEPKRDINP
jgi:hypothetical protein